MLLCIEKPKQSTKTLLEQIKISAEYKSYIQKSIVFLYTSNKQIQKEIKKTTPLIIAAKE